MRKLVLLWLLWGSAVPFFAAEIRGSVADARGGEPLARVRVRLAGTELHAVTDHDGNFAIANVPAGHYVLDAETVGYRLVKTEFAIAEGETKEFTIALVPETLRHTETIEVKADPYEIAQQTSPATNLVGNEIANLSTIVVHDPLRAVQALPGVAPAGNDDLSAQFTVEGAPFDQVGLYVDGVLVHRPFHEMQSIRDGASMTAFTSETVEELVLSPAAFDSRFGDRIGAALDIHTREGARSRPLFRGSAGVAEATFLSEGPLGPAHRGSWLVSARKSYLGFVTRQVSSDPTLAIGFYDLESKLTYDLTRRQSVALYVLDGHTALDRSDNRAKLGLNSVMLGDNHLTLSNLTYRATPNDRALLQANLAWMRERSETTNPPGNPLARASYAEWIGGARASWFWRTESPLDVEWNSRRIADGGYSATFFTSAPTRFFNAGSGTAMRNGFSAQQTLSLAHGRLRLSGGMRWDQLDRLHENPVSPHASAWLRLGPSTELQYAWGEYVQFPELHLLVIPYGGPRLQPERAIHHLLAIDQRLSRDTRIRIEAFDRDQRDLLWQPLLDPRLVDNKPVFLSANPYFNITGIPSSPLPLFQNSLRGFARGVQFTLQRRSANRLAGWIGYTLAFARQRDLILHQSFDSASDQRHTLNLYGSFRFTPSLNLSGKYSLGSGFPIEGYFRQSGGLYFLAADRNRARLDPYQRLDLRMNKSVSYDRWKLTFYGELLNATNNHNLRFTGLNSVNLRTGQASVALERTATIVPSAGVAIEF